jgi:hypothetical protein
LAISSSRMNRITFERKLTMSFGPLTSDPIRFFGALLLAIARWTNGCASCSSCESELTSKVMLDFFLILLIVGAVPEAPH